MTQIDSIGSTNCLVEGNISAKIEENHSIYTVNMLEADGEMIRPKHTAKRFQKIARPQIK